jgi:hypothetical protein
LCRFATLQKIYYICNAADSRMENSARFSPVD